MSEHEKIPVELNLLLTQQNVKKFEIKYEKISVKALQESFDEIPENITTAKNNLALILTKWQMEENSSYLKNKSLWEEYELVKRNLECIYQYFTCVKLTKKASKGVAEMVVNLTRQEISNEPCDGNVNEITEEKIFELIQDGKIAKLWHYLESCKRDYDIATKNFKILLEIIDFTWEDLNKLKRQYDDVFLKYQHARSQVERELPVSLEKMKEIFQNCLHLLEGSIEEFLICTSNLDSLVKSLIDDFNENKNGEY